MRRFFASVTKRLTPKRRWAQFSLATLFIFVTAICIAMGMVLGVTSGTCTREQLQAFPHTHILGSVAELPGLLLPGAGSFCA